LLSKLILSDAYMNRNTSKIWTSDNINLLSKSFDLINYKYPKVITFSTPEINKCDPDDMKNCVIKS
jgi:hypothetical protein